MKRLVFLLALALYIPLTAHADEASRRAKAKEMLTLLHVDRLTEQMMSASQQQIRSMTQQMAGQNLSPEGQAKLNDFQQKIFKIINDQVGWSVMEPTYIDLYAKTFTDEELDAIVTFYKSPAGISMTEKLPGLSTQAMKLAQDKMSTVQPQLKQMLEDFARNAHPAPPSQPQK